MSQFASTLYPQTNPTNPILLAFRDWLDDPVDMTEAASWWLDQFDGRGDSWSSAARALDSSEASPSQHRHARRVLTRLAALSG